LLRNIFNVQKARDSFLKELNSFRSESYSYISHFTRAYSHLPDDFS